jgi:hypothetical protein
METIFFWILTFFAWETSKKMNISTTYVIALFILIASAFYSFFIMFNPNFASLVWEFMVKTFAVSQTIWLVYNKYIIEK